MVKNRFETIALTSPPKHHFFGYYDKSPWSKDGRYFIYLETTFIDKHPEKDDVANILLKDTKTGEIKKIAETKAWNWQQGCMLQWRPDKYGEEIIFNDRRRGNFVSVIYNIKTKKETILSSPIYAIHPKGKLALTLNFSRLDDVRKGYGYEGTENRFKNQVHSKEDGIFLINLESKEKKLIVSLEDLYNFNTLDSMNFGKHWVNHVEFNKDGSRFCFFHRWQVPGKMHYTRLITCDLINKDLYLFPDSGFYSHVRWKNNKELFGYALRPSTIGNVRKKTKKSAFVFKLILPIYRKLIPKSVRKKILPIGYFLFEDKSPKMQKVELYGEDGHSSWSPDERFILTDTYPDQKHFRTLILFDSKNDKKIILGRYYTLPNKRFIKDKEWDISGLRCDLHPRWNFNGSKICFDSVHEGSRQVYSIDIE